MARPVSGWWTRPRPKNAGLNGGVQQHGDERVLEAGDYGHRVDEGVGRPRWRSISATRASRTVADMSSTTRTSNEAEPPPGPARRAARYRGFPLERGFPLLSTGAQSRETAGDGFNEFKRPAVVPGVDALAQLGDMPVPRERPIHLYRLQQLEQPPDLTREAVHRSLRRIGSSQLLGGVAQELPRIAAQPPHAAGYPDEWLSCRDRRRRNFVQAFIHEDGKVRGAALETVARSVHRPVCGVA